MTDKAFKDTVKRITKATGCDFDRPVEEHLGWHFGERVRIIEDDEPNGLFEGDEGYLVPEEVGDEKYSNVQVKLYFIPDGSDSPFDIDSNNIESIQ